MPDVQEVFRMATQKVRPDPGFGDRQYDHRHKQERKRKIGAFVVVAAIGAAAVVVVVRSAPDERPSRHPGEGPSQTSTPTPAVVGPTGPLAGRITRVVAGIPFSFTVPQGGFIGDEIVSDWEAAPIERLPNGGVREGLFVTRSTSGPQGAEAIIFWTSFPDGVLADRCATVLSPSVGPTAADLAAAVAAAPGTDLVSGPSDVTVGGRPAKHVELIVREDVGCDPGFFYTWPHRECLGACWLESNVGDTIRVWIIDVKDVRLFIEAETSMQANRDLENQIQQIIDSIRFD